MVTMKDIDREREELFEFIVKRRALEAQPYTEERHVEIARLEGEIQARRDCIDSMLAALRRYGSSRQNEIHGTSRAKGWWDDEKMSTGELNPSCVEATIPSKLMLVVSELSEALEEYRKPTVNVRECYVKDGKPEGFAVEMADAVIRLYDLAGALGIDLDLWIREKMDFNATRPHRHGGKRA